LALIWLVINWFGSNLNCRPMHKIHAKFKKKLNDGQYGGQYGGPGLWFAKTQSIKGQFGWNLSSMHKTLIIY